MTTMDDIRAMIGALREAGFTRTLSGADYVDTFAGGMTWTLVRRDDGETFDEIWDVFPAAKGPGYGEYSAQVGKSLFTMDAAVQKLGDVEQHHQREQA